MTRDTPFRYRDPGEPIAVGDLVLIRNGWSRVEELSETSLRVGASGMSERPIWVWRSEVRKTITAPSPNAEEHTP